MTQLHKVREVDVAQFCAAPADLVRFVERGGVVTLLRDGAPVATLRAGGGIAGFEAQESAAVYAPISTPEPTQAPATALVRLLGGAAVRSVLAVFLREPEREIHQREVARRAGVGLRSAQLALERLGSLGLLESRRDGNRLYYRATRDSRFEELRQLLAREIGIPEVLARYLDPLSARIRWAFVYGSVAAGPIVWTATSTCWSSAT